MKDKENKEKEQLVEQIALAKLEEHIKRLEAENQEHLEAVEHLWKICYAIGIPGLALCVFAVISTIQKSLPLSLMFLSIGTVLLFVAFQIKNKKINKIQYELDFGTKLQMGLIADKIRMYSSMYSNQ